MLKAASFLADLANIKGQTNDKAVEDIFDGLSRLLRVAPLFIYDFVSPQAWVAWFQKITNPRAFHITQEIKRQLEWELAGSDVRMMEPEPPTPVKDTILREISEDFNRNCLRAFHAARRVKTEAILEQGLLALKRRRQIEFMQREYSAPANNPRAKRRLKAWADWSEDTDNPDTYYREVGRVTV